MTEQADAERKKRPASQYYWGDWWKDKGLHSCSLAARGLWHEMNCLMHEGEPYGHLTLNGRAMSVAQLANQCRIGAPQCTKLLRELEDAGVPSKTPDGVLFSRRMVRDEAVRNARANGGQAGAEHGIKGAEHGAKGAGHGAKGGRPASAKGGLNPPLEGQKTPPPSSSSSSSSLEESTSVLSAHPPDPTRAGTVCRAMKAAGLQSVNPSDPRLLALLNAGITDDELIAAATDTARAGKPWGYALATAEGRRRDAAAITPLPAQAARRTTAVDRQIATINALTGRSTPDAARPRSPGPADDIIDADARPVA